MDKIEFRNFRPPTSKPDTVRTQVDESRVTGEIKVLREAPWRGGETGVKGSGDEANHDKTV